MIKTKQPTAAHHGMLDRPENSSPLRRPAVLAKILLAKSQQNLIRAAIEIA
ncbi:hypothetical protein [Rhizobium lentis]|uniref:Uncharacterized protein n=1 Tax=Rhizobium lentis TaxID=1138194 RepID=A0A7W8XJM3_9HYPH|nr:hypothetical protein [Rhizobium lentis]MBB4576926.1 hypothetical protein [Rhizobium lentis]MBB5553487.1 hypothetical protein [Rhizobium lentis]MBB5564123.1 hypothetical protein [Rhizobium lentis]MBB5570535.1 hypothetical protein [Rhizobium lentis]